MQTFLISDTHFSHANICKFKTNDGLPLRPFTSADEMDEHMIQAWNSVVGSKDKVYHLGDIAMCNVTKFRTIMSRLNGEKVLIKGNHDNLKLSAYAEFFKDVRACHSLDNLLLTHIPIHTESLARWRGNIHGHLHSNRVLANSGEIDIRYFSVCAEVINYVPIAFDKVNKVFQA